MRVEATTQDPAATGADTIAQGLFEDGGRIADGVVGQLIGSGEARGKLGALAVAHDQGRRFVVVGLGRRGELDGERARVAAAAVDGRAQELGTRTLCWEVPSSEHAGQIAVGLIEGTLLHAYRFDRYQAGADGRAVERLIISSPDDLAEVAHEAAVVAAAQNRARDLGNTPSNDLTPAALAGYAGALADSHGGLAVTTLDGEQIRELGMGAFAAVAQGSAQDAKLILIDYEGPGSAGGPRLGLIGKGVTFDSGGLSLKPARDMHEMKFDMCGAAAVIEAIAALAELQAPVRVLGVVGATENLPSGTAVKPGDIVRALDGTTIEVDNTDAEGRLVLADCLCYARREGCDRLVDIATLTGAVVVALGSTYAGLMSDDVSWGDHVLAAAAQAGEPAWRLPLHPEYARMIKGRYAQLTNRAPRREAMAITAAELLHHFAGGVPWAHLDIAGTAWDVQRPYFSGKGATGFGVRLLVNVARRAHR